MDYTVKKSNGTLYAVIKEQEVIGPVGFPAGGDQYFSSPLNVLLINQPSKQFQVAGDKTARFISGFQFQIQNSAGNNGTYTVVSSSYNGSNTVITVSEVVPSVSDPKGAIVYQVPVSGTGSVPRTSLTLYGRSVVNYGDFIAENFLHLLENFSSSDAPPYPITGQIWYDSGNSTLKVYDGTSFQDVGGGGGGGGAPTNASYLVLSPNGSLTSERVLSVESSVLTITDAGAGNTLTISVATGGITTGKLAAGAVDNSKIADSAVTTTKIANNNVSFAKMQTVATSTLVGRSTAGTGNIESLTLGSGLVLSGGALNTAANTAKLDVAQTYTKSQSTALVTLTDAANIATDASGSNAFIVTLAGNRTLSNPTNLVNGQTVVWHVKQDGIGGRTLAYGSNFKFPGGTAPILTTAAGSVDMIVGYVADNVIRCTVTLDVR